MQNVNYDRNNAINYLFKKGVGAASLSKAFSLSMPSIYVILKKAKKTSRKNVAVKAKKKN